MAYIIVHCALIADDLNTTGAFVWLYYLYTSLQKENPRIIDSFVNPLETFFGSLTSLPQLNLL